MKKFLSVSLGLALMLVMPAVTSAAVIGSLTLNPTTGTLGQNIAVNGTCNSVGANGNAAVSINNGTTTISFGSVTTDATGNFNQTFAIPSNFPSGNATITVTCPNSDTVTGNLVLNTALGGALTITGNSSLGQNVTVMGSCGTAAAQGSTVSFILTRGSNSVSVGSTPTPDANGTFSANLNIPSSFGGGPASIVASCPNGNITQATSVTDPNAFVAVGSTAGNIGQSVNVSGVCGTAAGQTVTVDLVTATTTSRVATITTSTNGTFNTVITPPSSTPAGVATVVATCPGGNVATTAFTVNPAVGSDVGGGDTGGVTTTPVGGVSAGDPVNNLAAILLLLVVGVSGVIVSRYKLSNDQFGH